ncbi:MAG: conjugal transfer protein TraB [Proteobacteria bacterium]|nr:conjugal transfer protein TraB [Pseudomonadota bacterium]
MQEEINTQAQDTGGAPAKRKILLWDSLDPKKKRIVSVTVISVIALIMMLFAYQSRQKHKEIQTAEKIEAKDINLDTSMIEETLQDVLLKRQKEKDQELEDLKDKIKELADRKKDIHEIKQTPHEQITQKNELNEKEDIPYPLPPPSPRKVSMEDKIFHSSGMENPPSVYQTVEMVGGINSSPITIEPEKKTPENPKNSIFLPPSFVEATLLSGVTAKTKAQAKSDPSPLLFRIKDLAILPNRVKANLKGCFVIGEGVGDLADERVHARLVTLSCVSKNGESVIDHPVKGWAEDNADGRVGLQGRVVAKMGTHVARTALAGFIGGFGDAMNAASSETSLTTSGIPTSIYTDSDMKTFAKAGMGSGMKGASDDLKKFYLDLAAQTIPVIEVLPAKEVTLVFSEGVDLTIKDVNLGGTL